MAHYLDDNGFLYFVNKLKAWLAGKVDKVAGKDLSTNDYTTAEKNKLAGLSNYTHPTTSGNKHVPSGGASGQILRWGADGTAIWGADNNTTYAPMTGASASVAGTAGLVPAPAAGAANRYLRSDGTFAVPPDTNTTYSAATTSAAGLMSAADKAKLDGVASGANKYTHPAYTARSAGLYKVTVDATGHVTDVTEVAKSDITGLGIPAQDTTYADATTSAHGLMTAADKTKLNAVPTPSSIATQSYVAQQVAAAGHITKSIVSALPEVSAAKENVIYMVAKSSASGNNGYTEYMLISGAFEVIGDTATVIESITNSEIDNIIAG